MIDKEVNNMKIKIAAVAVLTASIIAHTDQASAAGRDWAPCANDEFVPGVKCVWDARHDGNGEGRSFFTNAKGVHFVSHARAHRMLNR